MIYDLQKANMWKRASAYILDVIILSILAVGIGFLLSLCLGYDAQIDKMEAAYTAYEEKYGIDLNITEAEYAELTDDQKAVYEEADKEFSADMEVQNTTSMIIYMTLMIITFGILGAYLISEVIVPLIFKNGQTIGKKIFGVAVMRVDGVRLSTMQLIIRTVLGKFTIETMFPIFLVMMILLGALGVVGTAVLVMLLILQIAVLIMSKTNSAIHDLIAGTVTVDMVSQMIFDTPEELMEYKKQIHAQNAGRATY